MNSFGLKLCINIIILLSSLILAQEYKFDTHSLDLKGELSKDDAYQDNFGRFDAYELSMQEDDYIKIKLKSEFFPLLTVVAPSGTHKIAFPADENPVVNLEKEIDETGHWYIYVSGDSTDIGAHELQLCYVAGNTRQLPSGANICTITKYLLAHSNTKFFFYRDRNCEITENQWDVNLEDQNLFENAEVKVEGNSISFNLQANTKVSKDKFNKWSYQISECLTDDWIEKTENNKTVFTESSGTGKIKIKFTDNAINLSFITVAN